MKLYVHNSSSLPTYISDIPQAMQLKLCRVGEHQHRLAHQCSPCEKNSTHMKCEVKHNGDMGMGIYGL